MCALERLEHIFHMSLLDPFAFDLHRQVLLMVSAAPDVDGVLEYWSQLAVDGWLGSLYC